MNIVTQDRYYPKTTDPTTYHNGRFTIQFIQDGGQNNAKKDHSDIIPFMFGEEFIEGYRFCHGKYWSDDEKELSKRMMRAWAHFAKVSLSAIHPNRAIKIVFRLEIRVLRTSKISAQAKQHMFSQHQQIK